MLVFLKPSTYFRLAAMWAEWAALELESNNL